MAFIRIVQDGKVIAERQSTFGNKELPKDLADAFSGKNIKVHAPQNSRNRRKQK